MTGAPPAAPSHQEDQNITCCDQREWDCGLCTFPTYSSPSIIGTRFGFKASVSHQRILYGSLGMKCDRLSRSTVDSQKHNIGLSSRQTGPPPKMQWQKPVNFSLDFLSAQRDRANKLQILKLYEHPVGKKFAQKRRRRGKNWVFFMPAIIC